MISTLRQEFLRWLRWARRAPPGLWLRVRRRLGCCGCPWPAPHRVGGRSRRGEAQEGPTERAAHRGVCGISNQVGEKQEFRSASQVHSQNFLGLVKGHEKPKVVPFPSSDHKKHHNHHFLFCAQCPFTSNYWLLGGGDNPRHVPWNGVLHIFWGFRSYSWGVSWSLWSCAHIIYVYLEPKWPLFLKVNPPKTWPCPMRTGVIWVLGVNICMSFPFPDAICEWFCQNWAARICHAPQPYGWQFLIMLFLQERTPQ